MPNIPVRTLALAALVALILVALLGWRAGCQAADRARKEASVAAATGKALDKVAEQTPVIRDDQKQKEKAVDQIEGSDARLPDNFGSSLERVRRGGRDNDS